MRQPLLVGLIGGIASGKSTVARRLAERGGLWLNSDRMAHEVLNSAEAIAEIKTRFGEQVIDTHGQVDRSQLAAFVFGNDDQSQANRKWLEQQIHPRVRELSWQRIKGEGAQHAFVVIDAPLLIEAGWDKHCDRILMVDAPLAKRQTWAGARGWSAEELAKREAAQLPIEEKKSRATDIISNSGSLEELIAQVDAFVQTLL